jgi:hypothetical protein
MNTFKEDGHRIAYDRKAEKTVPLMVGKDEL